MDTLRSYDYEALARGANTGQAAREETFAIPAGDDGIAIEVYVRKGAVGMMIGGYDIAISVLGAKALALRLRQAANEARKHTAKSAKRGKR